MLIKRVVSPGIFEWICLNRPITITFSTKGHMYNKVENWTFVRHSLVGNQSLTFTTHAPGRFTCFINMAFIKELQTFLFLRFVSGRGQKLFKVLLLLMSPSWTCILMSSPRETTEIQKN